MNLYQLKKLDESYNVEMLAILPKAPIEAGGMAICFDKQPDIFAQSKTKYFQSKHVGFFSRDSLKGFGSIGYYNAFIGGTPAPVYYLHNFYVLPEARRNNFILQASNYFIAKNEIEGIHGFAIAMKGNKPIEGHLKTSEGKISMRRRIIDSLVVKNILFSIPARNKTKYSVRNANERDIPEISALLKKEYAQRLFGTYITEEIFMENLNKRKNLSINNYFVATNADNRIVGVCGAWDCSSYRQTRVIKYSGEFLKYAFLYRLTSKLFQLSPLPGPGDSFKEITIIDSAVKERDPEIMHALLAEIYHCYRGKGYHYINWGSCGSDNLLKAARGFIHRNTLSNIILISPPSSIIPGKDLRLPFVDIAFL